MSSEQFTQISESDAQQYLEGPWNKVSGETPLSPLDLEQWGENLDKMFGESNWLAMPNEKIPGSFDITVSPDAFSSYAMLAREYDQQGKLNDPSIQKFLAEAARQDHKVK